MHRMNRQQMETASAILSSTKGGVKDIAMELGLNHASTSDRINSLFAAARKNGLDVHSLEEFRRAAGNKYESKSVRLAPAQKMILARMADGVMAPKIIAEGTRMKPGTVETLIHKMMADARRIGYDVHKKEQLLALPLIVEASGSVMFARIENMSLLRLKDQRLEGRKIKPRIILGTENTL